jgi:hypothetical protein
MQAYYSLWPLNSFVKVSVPVGDKPKLPFVLDCVARFQATVVGDLDKRSCYFHRRFFRQRMNRAA